MFQGLITGQRRGAALLLLLACLPLAATAPASPGQDRARPLVLGVLPYMSPIALLKRLAPLRDYLGQQLGRPVVLVTARDYPEFIRRTNERHYDAVITAPHFVPLALERDRYRVQATYAKPLSAVVLVRADSDIDQLSDLAGASVATPPDHAIVSWVGMTLIDDAVGIADSPRYRAAQSHNTAYSAVVAGEVDAAIVTVSLWDPSRSAADGLRELGRSAPFPAMGILLAADLPSDLQERFGAALAHMHRDAKGRAVLNRIGYPGYRRADTSEFDGLRPYTERVRHLLEHGS